MTLLFTTLMAGFGFSFIYLNWKSPNKETRLNNWIGWSLALSSIVLLVLSDGLEFGLAYGLFGLAIIPLVIALLNIEIRNPKNTSRNESSQRSSLSLNSLKSRILKNLSYFIIVVPVCLMFSLFTLLLVTGLTNSHEINRLTTIVVGLPFMWALIAYLYLYSQRKKMFGSALTLATVILSAITFI